MLEECDNDLDFAIKKLNEFCLGTTEEKLDSVEELNASANQGMWLLLSYSNLLVERQFVSVYIFYPHSFNPLKLYN